MAKTSRAPGPRAGFTLIELIVTLVVLGMIVVLSLAAVSQIDRLHRSQRNLKSALTCMRRQAQIVKDKGCRAYTPGKVMDFDPSIELLRYLPGGVGTVAVETSDDLPGLKTARIEVKWQDPGGEKNIHTIVYLAPSSRMEADGPEEQEEEYEEEGPEEEEEESGGEDDGPGDSLRDIVDKQTGGGGD